MSDNQRIKASQRRKPLLQTTLQILFSLRFFIISLVAVLPNNCFMKIFGNSIPPAILMLGLLALLTVSTACTERPVDDGDGSGNDSGPELRLAPTVTKVDGDSFEADDRLGLFMIYSESENKQNSALYLDNQGFICKEKADGTLIWESSDKLYWKDETSPADFICYYPYNEAAKGQQTLHFSVHSDQSSREAFSGSDILWGIRSQVVPTSDVVSLTTTHRCGQLRIELLPGKGYDSESLANAVEEIAIKGGNTRAILDLSTGELRSDDSGSDIDTDIIPYGNGLTFRALLPPQRIEALSLAIRVSGIDRKLETSLELVSGQIAHCTITVNKLADGLSVGIDSWVDGNEDYGGVLN